MKNLKRKKRFYRSVLDEHADFIYTRYVVEKLTITDIKNLLYEKENICIHRTSISRWLLKHQYKSGVV